MQRAKTASAMVGAATPRSRADWLVHLPVPFWPALSRIDSTSGPPVSGSFCREDVGGDLDEVGFEVALVPAANCSCISSWLMPRTFFMMKYASLISSMSPYSMPLWTILT